MYTLEVGKPYNPARRSWPEGVQYNYRGGMHELVLFWAKPTAAEVRAARAEAIQLGLFVEQPAVVLLYRVALSDWSDAPYSWHLVPEAERTLPPIPGPEERALLQVMLVDARDGILQALRAVSMSPELTAALHAAIREQARMPFDRKGYERQLDTLYRRFPHSRDMAKAAAITEEAGRV